MSGRLHRAVAAVRGWDPLVWLGLAWLLGPLPGQGDDGLWWWHVGAAVLAGASVAARARGTARPTGLGWTPGRRWRSAVVLGWAALASIAAAQLLDGDATVGQLATFASAAVVAALGPAGTVGGAAVRRAAVGGLLLAAGTAWAFGRALGVAGEEFVFYRVKQEVALPLAAHNVLASLLLVAAAAVVVVSLRGGRWRLAVPLLGVALGLTLSRGALVAGAVAVGVALLVVRDRATARRYGVVVAVAGAVVLGALATWGAAVPDPGGPTSVVARGQLWDAALQAAVEEPVTGVGLDGFRAYAAAQAGVPAPHEHAHDLLLHAAATTGVPGLLATIAVWGGLAAGAWQVVDRDRRTLLLVGLAALGSHALVEETAFRASTEGLLALLVLVAAAPREPRPAAPPPTSVG